MAAPGTPVPFWVLNRDDYYYQSFQKLWSPHLHLAAMMSFELAEKLQKRYPESQVESQAGYNVNPKETLKSVGEPEAAAALSSAVKLAVQDGMSLESVLLVTERAYHAAK